MEFMREGSESRSNRYHTITEVKESKKLKIKWSQTHQRRTETVEMASTPNAFKRSAIAIS